MQWFRGGLVIKADRFLCHSTLGVKIMKKKRETEKERCYRGTSLIRNGIVLLYGPRQPLFLMSEVPLHSLTAGGCAGVTSISFPVHHLAN